jgi:very-short-patch-repair endonuclease
MRLDIQDPEQLLSQAWEDAKGKLEDLARALQIVKPIASHPWKTTQPGIILPDDEERIAGILDKCLAHHAKLGDALNQLVNLCGVSYPCRIDQISACVEAAKIVSHSIPINREVLLNSEWNKPSAQAEDLISKIQTYQNLKERLRLRPPVVFQATDFDQQLSALVAAQKMLQLQSAQIAKIMDLAGIRLVEFIPEVLGALAAASVVAQSMQVNKELLLNHDWDQQNPMAKGIIRRLESCQVNRAKVSGLFHEVTLESDLTMRAENYLKVSANFFKIVLPKFYNLKHDIMTWYAVPQKRSSVQISADLQPLLQYYKTRRDLLAHEDSAKQLFGALWKGEGADVAMLQNFSSWIPRFRQEMLKGTLTENACTVIERGMNKDSLCSVITECEKELPELERQMDVVWTSLGTTTESLIGRPAEKISLSDLEILFACLKVLVEIRKLDQAGKSLFGQIWAGEDSNSINLSAFAEWVVLFRQEILRGALTEDACSVVSQGPTKVDIESARSLALQERDDLITELTKLAKEVGWDLDKAFASRISPPLAEIECQLRAWREGLHTLQYWSRYVAVRHGCQNAVTSPVVNAVEAGTLTEPADVISCFEGNFADALLRITFNNNPILAQFAGEIHEKTISDFAYVDKELIRLNHLRLQRILIERKPRVYTQASRESEVGILIGQFNRKRNIMPIRKLMTQAGRFVQKIKPCFMMSPLSIAQFLDPTSVSFDVIIFDEASQVKPEDALGALMRGMQLVVMGDTRQLPPTSFFDRVAEDDIDDDEKAEGTSVADVESILHQCKRRFPYKMLNRHYRSRHESLITVSNVNFYNNKLQVFPASIDRGPSLGLQFMYLKDTVYDRGKTGAKNGLEAKAVAKAALEHFQKHPDKSLGIGTFSLKQMQAIQDQIELLRKDPIADEYFSANKIEPYFVKNLETIQGDERDVILISVGYGRASDGRLSQNFGPLNSDGGERRLNVLITRARESCVVFANFRASDLKTSGDSPVGIKAFKCFLEYAETGNLPVEHESLRDSDSPFEDSVYAYLCENGYEVRKQVGCSGFWIDLAVVDPQSQGRYLIGIECDGAMYHSSRVARDRDRLRQQILEGLHWKLHRVWSTDWYRNRNHTQRRLVEAIELAKINSTTNRAKITKSVKESELKPKYVKSQQYDGRNTHINITEIVKPVLQQASEIEIPVYQQCKKINIAEGTPLHEMISRDLARAVEQVVSIESPVHVEDVINRIRTLTGFGRAGNRIRDAILSAISAAISQKIIKRQKNFLWTIPDRPLQLRRRVELPKINMICDEEILEAIKQVLNLQHATMKQDLILQSARILGIHRTTNDIGAHIEKIITRSIKTGVLACRTNGAIDLS